MIQKKICLIGAFAVGKTSLIARLVKSIFSEKYHTTIGVKVDKKTLSVGGTELTLLVWDLAGDDRFGGVEMSYLRGASGYLLVADGTRRSTLDTAVALQRRTLETVGDIPFVLLLNKADLVDAWEIPDSDLDPYKERGWKILNTSAKMDEGVEDAFKLLAASILNTK